MSADEAATVNNPDALDKAQSLRLHCLNLAVQKVIPPFGKSKRDEIGYLMDAADRFKHYIESGFYEIGAPEEVES